MELGGFTKDITEMTSNELYEEEQLVQEKIDEAINQRNHITYRHYCLQLKEILQHKQNTTSE